MASRFTPLTSEQRAGMDRRDRSGTLLVALISIGLVVVPISVKQEMKLNPSFKDAVENATHRAERRHRRLYRQGRLRCAVAQFCVACSDLFAQTVTA